MTITDEAKKLVEGERQKDYGNMNDSFTRIAGLWSAYTGITIDKYDVAKMMILMKVSRAKLTNHRDSYLDIVAYVECADRLMIIDKCCEELFS